MTDEERNELVLVIADYIIDNNSTLRDAAKVKHNIHKEGFEELKPVTVSIATISDYMNRRLPKLNVEKYRKVQDILNNNKPKTIEDENVVSRINKAVELLKSGFTVAEIAKALDSTEMVINRDLTRRLECLSPEDALEVKKILKEHTTNNLINQGTNSKK